MNLSVNMSKNVVFIVCGSFNPPTPMHFRIFEIARDHFRVTQQGNVIGGIVSPVHNSYKKPNVQLIDAKDRCKMIELSLLTSEWIRLSDWESKQNTWMPTLDVLQYHQNYLNSILRSNSISNRHYAENTLNWIPSNVKHLKGQQVQVKLLCGADLLESFSNKKLWLDSQLETIFKEHGVVVVARNGSNPQKIIFESDVMFENQNNITIIENCVPNEISSTLVRLHLRRGLSLKYLLSDNVIEYIYKHKLYNSNTKRDSLLKQNIAKPIQSIEIQNPQNIVIDIKSEISDALESDDSDSSSTLKIKPHRCVQTLSTKKRKYRTRDTKTNTNTKRRSQ